MSSPQFVSFEAIPKFCCVCFDCVGDFRSSAGGIGVFNNADFFRDAWLPRSAIVKAAPVSGFYFPGPILEYAEFLLHLDVPINRIAVKCHSRVIKYPALDERNGICFASDVLNLAVDFCRQHTSRIGSTLRWTYPARKRGEDRGAGMRRTSTRT